jgi:DNA-binding response OmpR family regulator/S1-C subfamily serine protease
LHQEKDVVTDRAGKLLVVESDSALEEQIVSVLSSAGYEVSTDYRGGMKSVLDFEPDAVVLGADPPQLDCCDLLSEIKGAKRTHNIRVLMLSPGGAAERVRGLDLGADEVLSLPFDSHELLAKIRLQLQSKETEDELRERLKRVEENQESAKQVVTAVNEERRTVWIAGLAILVALTIGVLLSFSFYRRSRDQNVRVYAAITRLQSGVLTQQQLVERSRQASEKAELSMPLASDPQKLQLQKKSEDLRSQITQSSAENATVLQNQLAVVEGRLQKLETEGDAAHVIIRSYEPSVCLIHVVLTFRDRISTLKLHYAAIASNGEPETDKQNNPLVSLTGGGPEVRIDIFGTGFLVSENGQILTNHHVAEPWWQNDELKEMLDQGLQPEISEMSAYFPQVSHGIAITTEGISTAADVAVVKANISGLGLKQIALADSSHSIAGGSSVVLLGYPTGLNAILARTGAETLQSIAAVSNGDPKLVIEELAHRHLIKPTATQGHIGDVQPDKIIYDAQTTSGGSGGPLFDNEGKVIGINFAMVRDFGGSNFAIPVAYGRSLLKH